MKRILLTGGGTAGHVTPNIALLPGLRELGYEISYMGSYDGIEKKLIAAFPPESCAATLIRRISRIPSRCSRAMARPGALSKS